MLIIINTLLKRVKKNHQIFELFVLCIK